MLAMFGWAWLAFVLSDPFKWGTEEGTPTHVSPFGWMLFGVATYFLFRWAIINYIELVQSKPKRTFQRNSRSHYNTRKGK